jgi:multimeric flavodoxin WrbA
VPAHLDAPATVDRDKEDTMLVIGIVGSPRKEGRTAALIDAALAGATSAGAETQKVYLVDYDVRPFTGGGGSAEANAFCPKELSALCERADALVVGAPVYYGDINGLTKDWMDCVRIANSNGKPALGFAIAGGSGKGLISGVQSIYHWFYHRQVRAIDPTPVSRFNMEQALASLRASGARLVERTGDVQPFPGAGREDRWAAVLAYYATLPYFDQDPVDEFLMLARQLIALSTGEAAAAQAELDRALALIAEGKRSEGAVHAVRAYELLYF